MLEKLLTPRKYGTVSTPNAIAIANVQALIDAGLTSPRIAEIGLGIGATTQALCKTLNHRGRLDLYDRGTVATEIRDDLRKLGYDNVSSYDNSTKYWDSYVWTLSMRLRDEGPGVYDYIYLDGAHTLFHDLPAFYICDKLLKPGALIEFDDYSWIFKRSKWMEDIRHEFMTEEQIETPQVAMVIEMFVKTHPDYEMLKVALGEEHGIPEKRRINRLFRKLR